MDSLSFNGVNPVSLPDALRPVRGGPLSHSRRVYEQFAHLVRTVSDSQDPMTDILPDDGFTLDSPLPSAGSGPGAAAGSSSVTTDG